MAEYVKRIGALRQHRLRATPDDHQRSRSDSLVYDVTRDFYQLLISWTAACGRHGSDPLLRSKRERVGDPLYERRHSLFARGNLRPRYAKSRCNLIDNSVIEKRPSELPGNQCCDF
jgi:hypothetical protein